MTFWSGAIHTIQESRNRGLRLLTVPSFILIAGFIFAFPLSAQPRHEYVLTLENPQTHFLGVTLTVPAQGAQMDFSLPAWAPGSYQIANYAKFVQEFSARDENGKALKFRKQDKQTWRVFAPASAKSLSISYRIFANILSDVESELNDEHAQVFGPQVFMYPVDQKEKPVRLRVEGLRGWRIATGLEAVNDSTFSAPNYDELIDAPLEIGDFQERTFAAAGARFHLVVHGEKDGNRLDDFADKLQKIVTELMQMMGAPREGQAALFKKYVFIWHVDPRADYYGLEHLNSTSIGMPHRLMDFGSAGESWDLYRGLENHDIDLEYAAHEFFHLWNVKRIRPVELGPFDYTKEVYTTSLWIAEGFTDYYGYLTLVRTGLWSPRKWLRMYANIINRYRRASGWKYRSPSENSFDVWLWNYGEGEQGNLARTYFSYYPGGNLVGLCMDLRLRHETQSQHTLDEVMRVLWQRFGLPKPGFTEAQFWSTVTEVTGLSWDDFRQRYIDGREELPLDHYLALAGIRIDALSDEGAPYLGVSVKDENGQARIARVEFDSPAERSGLETGDRLVAIDGAEATLENWQELLHRHGPGSAIKVIIMRHGQLQEIAAVMGKQPPAEFELSLHAEATAEATALRERWWRGYAAGNVSAE